jgi:hypothetical protein
MKKNRIITSLCLAIMLFTISVITPIVKANSISQTLPEDTQYQIDALIMNYQTTLDKELTEGTTVIVNDVDNGSHIELTDESQQKMDALWRETVKQIEDLSARPSQERQKAIDLIQSLEPGDVTYLGLGHTPYDLETKLEKYQVGKYIYSIAIVRNEVIQIRLVDDTQINTEQRFNQEQLEKQAIDFIARVSPITDLKNLSPKFSNKENSNFFFRWEDRTRRLTEGSNPFIQIGLSASGDFLSFVNTLPLTSISISTDASPIENAWNNFVETKTVMAFNEVYANGGNYWGWEKQDVSYNTASNAGYCYSAGWCTPTNFYYADAPTGGGTYFTAPLRGSWLVNSNTSSDPSFYIPSTNATTDACYGIYYNGGSSSDLGSKCISQSAYSNTWVELPGAPWYNISKLALPNTAESSLNNRAAWDEAWVYNHN